MDIVQISTAEDIPDGATSLTVRPKEDGFVFVLERCRIGYESPIYESEELAFIAALGRARELGVGRLYRKIILCFGWRAVNAGGTKDVQSAAGLNLVDRRSHGGTNITGGRSDWVVTSSECARLKARQGQRTSRPYRSFGFLTYAPPHHCPHQATHGSDQIS